MKKSEAGEQRALIDLANWQAGKYPNQGHRLSSKLSDIRHVEHLFLNVDDQRRKR